MNGDFGVRAPGLDRAPALYPEDDDAVLCLRAAAVSVVAWNDEARAGFGKLGFEVDDRSVGEELLRTWASGGLAR